MKNSKWDFKLQEKTISGELFETLFSDIFEGEIKCEVKSELKQNWMNTGNIFIEIEQEINGEWVKSGLSVTESEYWIHTLKTEKRDELHCGLVFPTTTLKNRLKMFLKTGDAKIVYKEKTHDGPKTKGIIVDPRLLLYSNQEREEFKTKKEQQKKERIKELLKK
jgi:hypothetical protein